MRRNILVTLPMTEADRRHLADRGARHDLRTASPAGVSADDLAWADCVLGNVKPPEIIAPHPNIRWLHTPNVGLDAYAALAESRPDLKITNIKGIADHPVAEHILALLLSLTRALPRLAEAGARRDWSVRDDYGPHCVTLPGKRVHLLGFGSIARCLVEKLAGFGTEITVYRRCAEGGDPRVRRFRALEGLEAGVGEADILVNLLPGLPSTKGIVSAAVLAALPPHALLISAGRGSTVDEAALVAALARGRLRGAALDVFAEEPLPAQSPLWAMPNLILTPHVAGRFDAEMRTHINHFFDALESPSSEETKSP